MTNHQNLMKLRELLVVAEHGAMTNEALSEIEEIANKLFTPDVVRLVEVLIADALKWRQHASTLAVRTIDRRASTKRAAQKTSRRPNTK